MQPVSSLKSARAYLYILLSVTDTEKDYVKAENKRHRMYMKD